MKFNRPEGGATALPPFSTLSGKSALRQESELFLGRWPPQDRIAVRKTSEPLDDVEVQLGPGRHLVEAHGLSEAHRPPLRIEVLRMFEGHDEPGREGRRHSLMKAPRDRLSRQGERPSVAREHERAAAMDVARELIEQDDEAERPLRRFRPMVERAFPPFRQRLPEAHRKRPVEGGIPREPAALAGLGPELPHLSRRHGGSIPNSVNGMKSSTSPSPTSVTSSLTSM